MASKAERTREQIVKAAAAAIRAQGPDRVSVAGVMGSLKLTHGGFYAHFGSKDEMIAAALDAAFDDMTAHYMALTDDRPPGDALAAYVDWYVSADMRDHPERACPLNTLANDAARPPLATRARLSKGAQLLARRLAGPLRELGRPRPDAEAMSLVAEMVGAVILARLVAEPERSDEFLAAARDSLKARLGLMPS